MVSGGVMKAAYFKITDEKREIIENAAMNEFAHHSFNEASLNNIIKSAGISKGGMFKYIEDKTDLYIHIFEKSLSAFFDMQLAHMNANETCIIKRAFNMVIESQNFYLEKPLYFQLMIQGSIDFNSPCYDQLAVMRHELSSEQRQNLGKNIDWAQYAYAKEHVLSYLNTVFQGINIELLQLLTGDGHYNLEGFFENLNQLRDITVKGLKGV